MKLIKIRMGDTHNDDGVKEEDGNEYKYIDDGDGIGGSGNDHYKGNCDYLMMVM